LIHGVYNIYLLIIAANVKHIFQTAIFFLRITDFTDSFAFGCATCLFKKHDTPVSSVTNDYLLLNKTDVGKKKFSFFCS